MVLVLREPRAPVLLDRRMRLARGIRADSPGFDESVRHVRVISSEIFDRGGAVRTKHQEGGIRRLQGARQHEVAVLVRTAGMGEVSFPQGLAAFDEILNRGIKKSKVHGELLLVGQSMIREETVHACTDLEGNDEACYGGSLCLPSAGISDSGIRRNPGLSRHLCAAPGGGRRR